MQPWKSIQNRSKSAQIDPIAYTINFARFSHPLKHIFTPKKFGKFFIHTLLPSSGPAPAQLASLSNILIYSRYVAKDPPNQTLVAFGLKMEKQQQDVVIEFENCLKKLPSFWVDHKIHLSIRSC